MRTLLALLLTPIFLAQSATPQTVATAAAGQQVRRTLELQQDQMTSESQEKIKRRQAADFEAHEFNVRLAAFAQAWNDFMKDYSEAGTYNLKKAKSLSRALKRLQSQLPK